MLSIDMTSYTKIEHTFNNHSTDNVPPTDDEIDVEEHTQRDDSHTRPVRRVAVPARDGIIGCLTED